jgi:GR25 family glycosyltransferase involved in LPS biosynthesis
MITTPIFVITLEHRKDRQETVKSTLDVAGVDYKFIFSSRIEQEKKFHAMSKITAIEVAIWSSHVKALHEMLNTESQWALIFEDDFILKPRGLTLLSDNNILNSVIETVSDHYSMLQIGFLENSHSSKRSYVLAKTFKIIFRYNRFDLRSLINNFRFLGIKNGNKKTIVPNLWRGAGRRHNTTRHGTHI